MPRYHNVNNIKIQFTPEEEKRYEEEEAAWFAGADARAAKAIQDERRGYYESETDHLFFEEQRGEVPVGTWAAKVAEIKARIPKP